MSAKTIEEVLTDATPKAVTVFEVIKNVEELGGGKMLAVSHSVEPPKLFVAPNKSHEFNDIDGLVEYVKAFGSAYTVILGDVEKLVAHVSLDEMNGDGGFEVMTYKPMFHPSFKLWLEIVGKTMPVQDFAQFLLINRRHVQDGHQLALMFSQIRASKKVEISQGRGKGSINGVLVFMEIAGAKQEAFQELPETLVVVAPIFLRSPIGEVELDLLVSEKNEQVYVTVSAGNINTIVAQQFIDDIHRASELLPDNNITFGRINHTEKKLHKS